ncbi:MAG: ribosome maturation factor RimP [Lachnospiraceae bacterium]|nr:ribosome maturation factor RimP [Lachnospiraceae bacterium]
MTKREEYEQRAEQLLMPVIQENGFELVDVEYVKEAGTRYLRAYIDKEGGITIDDCELVSRAFGQLLDAEDFIEESYVLEVSSPGLGRPLKKEKDFVRSIGKDVEVKLFKPLSKEKKEKDFLGTLKSYDGAFVTIVQESGEELTLERSAIALIRLAFVW